MSVEIQCIVEGHGEQTGAIGVVVRRIGQTLRPPIIAAVPKPIRVNKSRIVSRGKVIEGEVARVVELAARKGGTRARVLLLLDADTDCPALLGPSLLVAARAARSDVLISVVLAKSEFEAWFLASAVSLRGYKGLSPDVEPPSQPESIRDCKGWLSDRMPRPYEPTIHQASMADRFDFQAAKSAKSFEKLYREVTWLLTAPYPLRPRAEPYHSFSPRMGEIAVY